jgi:hypothetical protein
MQNQTMAKQIATIMVEGTKTRTHRKYGEMRVKRI